VWGEGNQPIPSGEKYLEGEEEKTGNMEVKGKIKGSVKK
jgi:hypothetical protein